MPEQITNLQGELGSVYIANTTPWTGRARSVQCLSDCTFTTLTDSQSTPSAQSGITLTKGMIIYGVYTAITLATGSVKAYF